MCACTQLGRAEWKSRICNSFLCKPRRRFGQIVATSHGPPSWAFICIRLQLAGGGFPNRAISLSLSISLFLDFISQRWKTTRTLRNVIIYYNGHGVPLAHYQTARLDTARLHCNGDLLSNKYLSFSRLVDDSSSAISSASCSSDQGSIVWHKRPEINSNNIIEEEDEGEEEEAEEINKIWL